MTSRRIAAASVLLLACLSQSTTTQQPQKPDANGDGIVDSKDLAIVQANLGRRCGQPTFDVRADVDGNCIVNVTDIALVSRNLGRITNQSPIARIAPIDMAFVGMAVTADGRPSSDPENAPLTFSWSLTSRPAGSTAAIANADQALASFTPDRPGAYDLQLVVSDGTLTGQATVRVSTSNSPPAANAGPDQTVAVNDLVRLTAAASTDVDGDPLTYAWSFESRPPGTATSLSDATSATPSFLADAPGTYRLTLVVHDGTSFSAPDTVVISTGNSRPVANAGPDQSVRVGALVQLTGSGSTDADGQSLSFQWTLAERPAGSGAALSSVASILPTFQADKPGAYRLELVVADGQLASTPDSVTITTGNSPPVANAGPDQTAPLATHVRLDGSTSTDVDGDALTYTWALLAKPDGSAATLGDRLTVTPTFDIDLPGTYIAQLVVNDGLGNSAPDTVIIDTRNSAPVARAGDDQTVGAGDLVALDGLGSSDVDGDALGYLWSFVARPTGSTAVLNGPTFPSPTFRADVRGTYVLQLVVNDGTVNSAPDTVVISTANSKPVANAGPDQNVPVSSVVQLAGGGSFDPDGTFLEYVWAILNKPEGSGATLSDPASTSPTLVADKPGTFVVQLIVRDDLVDSAPDTIAVVVGGNRRPSADAGADGVVQVGATVTLDGSHSQDPDGQVLTYAWTLVTTPVGSTATLGGATSVAPTVTPDRAGAYVIRLTVSDGSLTATDDVLITAVAGGGFLSQITPNAGQQGQQDLTVTMTGQSTHWVQGVTAATFGAGITVGSFTVTSPTSAVVVLSISATAAVGARTVVVTTNAEVVTLPNAFTVQSGLATLLSVTADSALQGADATVTLTGRFTHFVNGQTEARFGPGVSVGGAPAGDYGPVFVTSPTTAIASLRVSPTPHWRQTPVGGTSPGALSEQSTVYDPISDQLVIYGGSVPMFSENFESYAVGTNLVGQGGWTGCGSIPIGASSSLPTKVARGDLGSLCNSGYNPGFALAFHTISGSVASGVSVLSFDSSGVPGTHNSGVYFGADTLNRGPDPDGVFLVQHQGVPGWILGLYQSNGPTPFVNIPGGIGVPVSMKIVIDVPNLALYAIYDFGNGPQTSSTITLAGNTSLSRWNTISLATDYRFNAPLQGHWDNITLTHTSGDLYRVTHASGAAPAQWVPVAAGGDAPGGRVGHSTAYDSTSDRMIIFGGGRGRYDPILNSVHVLVNAAGRSGPATWVTLNPTGSLPPGRIWHSAGYDPASNRMIVVGGRRDSVEYFQDLWVLTNANGLGGLPAWMQLTPTNGPGPLPRQFPSAAYDGASNQLVIWTHSPTDPTQTVVWTLSNANGLGGPPAWTQSAVPELSASDHLGLNSPSSILGLVGCSVVPSLLTKTETGPYLPMRLGPFDVQPPVRCDASGVDYDPVGDRLFLMDGPPVDGGVGPLADVWMLQPAMRAAATGARAVQVRTAAEQVAKPDAFHVLTGPPAFQLQTSRGYVGQSSTVEIRAANAAFVSGQSFASWGPGVSVGGGAEGGFGPLTVLAPDRALASLTISATATVATLSPTLRIGGSDVPLPYAYDVSNVSGGGRRAPPKLAPVSGVPGQHVVVQVTNGSNAFQQGVTRAYFGPGVTVNSITVQTANALLADLTIDPQAAVGARDVAIVYTSGAITPFPPGQFFLIGGGFVVLSTASTGDPTLSSISPATAALGDTTLVTITGQSTHFAQGATQVDVGPGIVVSAVTVSSPTVLTAQLSIQPDAALGARAVTVSTGSEIVSLASGFTLMSSPVAPAILSVAPSAVAPGATATLVVTAKNTHFTQGVTVVTAGAGISVLGITVTSPTTLEASISVLPSATLGGRTVLVATGTEAASLSNAFAVTATAPALTQVTPNGGQQGQQNIAVTIAGQSTHWVQGVTAVTFGTGITVGSLTVTSPTSAVAVLNVASSAAVGARTVVVTTNAEVVALPNAFTVQSGLATLLSVTADSALQGADATVTLTGRFTHFVNGQTEARFGPGVSVGGAPAGDYGPVFVTSPTTAMASLRVSPTPHWSRMPVEGTSPGALSEQSTIYDPISDQLLIYGGSVPMFSENFESYAAGTNLVGQGGWTGCGSIPIGASSALPTKVARGDLGGVGNLGSTCTGVVTGFAVASHSISGSVASGVSILSFDSFGVSGAHNSGVSLGADTLYQVGDPNGVVLVQHKDVPGWLLVLYQSGSPTRTVNIPGGIGLPVSLKIVIDVPNLALYVVYDFGNGPQTSSTITLAGNTSLSQWNKVSLATDYRSNRPQGQYDNITLTHTSGELYRITHASGEAPAQWVPVAAGGNAPGERVGHSTVYDVASDRMIIFGGGRGRYDPILNSVHVLVNAAGRAGPATWVPLNPTGALPLGRIWHSAGYDPASNRMIVVGGRRDSVEYFQDLWVLTNANGLGGLPAWMQLTPTNGPGPLPRQFPSAAYDGASNQLVIWTHSPTDPTQTVVWTLSNANGLGGPPAWTQYTVPELSASDRLGLNSPSSILGLVGCSVVPSLLTKTETGPYLPMRLGPFDVQPPVRCDASGVDYDPVGDRLFLMDGPPVDGGVGPLADVWMLQPAMRAAATGARAVQVRTAAEQVAKPDAFHVLTGPPAFQLQTSRGYVGQSSTVEIRAANAAFVSGQSFASWGPGVSVGGGAEGGFGPLTVLAPDRALASLTISATAAVATLSPTLRIGGSDVPLPYAYDVSNVSGGGRRAPPKLAPVSGVPGQHVVVQVTNGSNAFQQGVTRAYLGPGVTVNSITVQTANALLADLTIDPQAAVGARDVAIVYTSGAITPFPPGQFFLIGGGFAVLSTASTGDPTLTSISPASAAVGDTTLVTITGQSTHFAQGATQVDVGPGIATSAVTVSSPTVLTAQLSIQPDAALGARAVTVSTGSEIVSLASGFTLTSSPVAPAILSVAPSAVAPGATATLVVTAKNTHFTQGVTVVTAGGGISVLGITVTSPTTLEASISVLPSATLGGRTVLVATGTEAASLSNAFAVTATAPALTQVSPNGGQQGQQNIAVTIAGQSTHWVQGVTAVTFGTGITVGSLTVTSPTSAVAVLNVASTAAVGARTVVVTTNAEVVTLPNAFTVQSGLATLLSVTADSALQGADATVTLTGRFTHFLNGQTEVRFGEGISVGGAAPGAYGPVLVTSPTTAVASLHVNSAPHWSETPVGGTSPAPLFKQSTIYDPISDQLMIYAASEPIFSENFESYAPGTNLIGQGGWFGCGSIPIGASSSLPTKVARGDLGSAGCPGTTSGFAVASHSISGSVASGISILSFDSFGAVLAHNSGVNITAGPYEGSVSVDGVFLEQNLAGGWFLDLIKNSSAIGQIFIPGGIGIPVSMKVVIDVPNLVTYAIYDFGSGPQKSTTISLSGITNLNQWNTISIYADYRSSRPAGQYENITLTQSSGLYRVTHASGAAASQWVPVTAGGNAPGARVAHSIVYDSTSDRMIIFGGGAGGNDPILNSAHVLVNAAGRSGPATWVALNPTGPLPSARMAHSAVYDAANNRMMIVGGRRSDADYLQDIWVLTNANGLGGQPTWMQLNPTNAPGPLPRQFPSVAYDGTTNQLVLSTYSTTDPTQTVVWTLSNANGLGGASTWTQSGVPERTPGGRLGLKSAASIVGLLDCSPLPSVLDKTETSPYASVRLGPFAAQPPTRCDYSGVDYDPAGDRLFLVGGTQLGGGVGTLADVWMLQPAMGSAAAVGPRLVQVRTAAEQVAKEDAFRVVAATGPPAFQLHTTRGYTGRSVTVEIRAANAAFVTGQSLARWGAGVSVGGGPEGGFGPLTVLAPDRALASLAVASTAAVAFRSPTVRIGGTDVSLPNAYYISNAVGGDLVPPTLVPTSGTPGQHVVVQVTNGTNLFQQGVTRAYLGPGITVNSITVQTTNALLADLTIDPQAALGARDVAIVYVSGAITPYPFNQYFIIGGGFAVLPSSGQPTLSSIAPATAALGDTVLVTINGQSTHFAQGTTQVDVGPGIAVDTVTVLSPTVLTAQLRVLPDASIGTRAVTVSTGSESVSLASGFTVTSSPVAPAILSVAPSSVTPGATTTLVVTAKNTHFTQGVTVVTAGAGISVLGITVTSPTTLEARIGVLPSAALGGRTVLVATGAEAASLDNALVVAASAPAITQVVPNAAEQGQQGEMTIVGANTHFTNGVTTVDLGPGIAVTGVAVTCSTCVELHAAIAHDAAPGPHAVVVTTGAEKVVSTFTVLAGTPMLTSLSQASGQRGQTLAVTITGKFTHFVQGTTAVDFAAGISITNVAVTSPTSLSASLTIASDAVLGPHTMTVSTGSEVVFVANVFSVLQAGNQAPLVTAGQDQTISLPAIALLAGFATDDGLPAGHALTYGWSLVSGPGPVTFANATSLTTTASFSAKGTYVLRLSVSDSLLTGTDEVSVFVDPSGNRAPTVSAGPDLSTVLPAPVTLVGSATDDGLPEGAVLVYSWFQVTGPAPVLVNQTNLPTLVAAFSTPGTYVLRLVVNDGELTGSDDVVVVANPSPNKAPVINAGADQTVTLPAGTTLVGAVSDDGLPAGAIVGTAWAQVSGPAAAVLTTPGTLLTPVTFPTAGIYVFRLTGTDTALSAADDVAIRVLAPNNAPVPSAGADTSVVLPASLTLPYSVTDDGKPAGGTLTLTWTTVSGPGTALFSGQTPTTITVGFDAPGTYVLRLTATDTQFTVSDDITVVVTGVVAPPPTLVLTTPVEGSEITAPTSVVGTVTSPTLVSWALEVRMADETAFRSFATGTGQMSNASLGTFDPTLLLNGIAYIRLSAADTSGHSYSTAPVSVLVTKNQKVGNFTVSFNDLTVPVAGFPIQVVRTYDSRDKSVGDFGVGWRLDVKSVRLQENRTPGGDWVATQAGGVQNRVYCVQEAKPHIVSATLPDGTVYRFRPVVTPQCQQFVPIEQVAVSFAPLPDSPVATLTVVGNTLASVTQVNGPIDLFDLDNAATFDPNVYLLTLPDGRALRIRQDTGLDRMTDLHGNTLTISATGVVHSSGVHIDFVRDTGGRIQKVTDPDGHAMTYGYDTDGNLANFRDRENQISTYGYNARHDLLTITDPRGLQPIRNEYDDVGRLTKHIDAFGHEITYTHNLAARQEVVEDRLGHLTVNEYDDAGNIVRVTDAQGGVTQRTYDARGNMLSETNPLGKVRSFTYDARDNRLTDTDPLGHTTTYTYNARNQVLTITDALGHVTTNTYDATGNLLTVTDPSTQVTRYTYTAAGLPSSVTDPLGQITTSVYDTAGHLTRQTDALGHVTISTYDGRGNRLTETRTRTTATGPESLVTRYQYDALGRLTQTTFADGSATQTIYNAIGKPEQTIDPIGRVIRYGYDAMGRAVETTFPDGSRDTSTYDAEGRRVTSTDRMGRITTSVYDPVGRMTETRYPDGTATVMAYDALGQVRQVTDARGNATGYEYDDTGRRTRVIDALGHATVFHYDVSGNQVAVTDAAGHTTGFTYDATNRRTRTTYGDGTFEETGYDGLGRTISKRDQAGLVTRYEYDALGRLTAVLDARNQYTRYGYDELGNRTTQTDANNHTTGFAYDALGRRSKRTLPLGMSETMTYDVTGNLKTKTDFNGRTTAYTYDLLNRLTLTRPDPALGEPNITFSYTAVGERAQMVDASGTTTYAYDTRDRLILKVTPQGTLTYGYDAVGNLASMRSSNVGGTAVTYAYDPLNRLVTTNDGRLTVGDTTYVYDEAGNLASFKYPNGVQHDYSYNALNRLTALTVANATGSIAGYGYNLGPTGNRTRVVELGGRSVEYTYDELYRLKSETVAGGAGVGTTSYGYDPVGNRLLRTTPSLGTATYTYDGNDRLTTDTYDANGNTLAGSGATYGYDYANHLTTQNGGTVRMIYDGDGNRIAKTVGGVTTRYLVDDRNLTGYAQVLEELAGGAVPRVYTYGLNRISQSQASGTSFYGYDGHGNVRALTDSMGLVTDRYDYDAFGNGVSQVGTTPNVYLYSSEQSDPNLGFYYLRSRYYVQGKGRFLTSDRILGSQFDPPSLHLYVYALNNPVSRLDPQGTLSLPEMSIATAISNMLRAYETYTLVKPAFAVVQKLIAYKGLENIQSAFLTPNRTNEGIVFDVKLSELVSRDYPDVGVECRFPPNLGGRLDARCDKIVIRVKYSGLRLRVTCDPTSWVCDSPQVGVNGTIVEDKLFKIELAIRTDAVQKASAQLVFSLKAPLGTSFPVGPELKYRVNIDQEDMLALYNWFADVGR